MSKLKRLATKEDNIVVIESPITRTELSEREKDYPLLFSSDFAKKYRDPLFQHVKFHFKGQPFLIQFNRCTMGISSLYFLSKIDRNKIRKGLSRICRCEGRIEIMGRWRFER
ncbi:hypothetical protein J7E95_15975 [Streptomyces sp. ISL-14]|nr:hypothetical protein [Streptomyces sp. ISL-14]